MKDFLESGTSSFKIGKVLVIQEAGLCIFFSFFGCIRSQWWHRGSFFSFSKLNLCGLPWCLRQKRIRPQNVGDSSSIPWSGRSPGEGNGYPLQYSCLENSMDRGAWRAPVHGVSELDTTDLLTLSLFSFFYGI